MDFKFGWNDTKKIEKINPSNRKIYVTESTPKEIVTNPSGYRNEDILHSLCLIVKELILTAEEQAKEIENKMEMLNRSLNGEEEVKVEKEVGEDYSQDNGESPQGFEESR